MTQVKAHMRSGKMVKSYVRSGMKTSKTFTTSSGKKISGLRTKYPKMEASPRGDRYTRKEWAAGKEHMRNFGAVNMDDSLQKVRRMKKFANRTR